MKLVNGRVIFEGYKSGRPGVTHSSFTDDEGSVLVIDTKTLIRMYELVKFDLGEHAMNALEEEILKGE